MTDEGLDLLDLAQPERAMFADLGRTRLRLWEWGDPGAPATVLIHGGWDHGRMWDGIAPRLAAAGHRAVAVDLRGHGDSGRLPVGGSYWLMFVLDLALLARLLGPPVCLVGHSFGGGLSLSLASSFPDLVDRVVNIDGMGPPPEMMIVRDHAAHAEQWFRDAERIWSEPQREYGSVQEMAERRKAINLRLPLGWCLHLAVHGSMPGPNGGLVWKSDPAMRLGSPLPFGERFLRAEYERIERPVLVLTGAEGDQWSDLPAEVLAERVGSIRDARHEQVAGAGHYVHIEQPDAVLRHMGEFLA